MTLAAMQAATSPAPAKKVKGNPRWGDLLLRIAAGLVLFYLFLPIFVIILFSFNKPAGKFNYTWQGFTLENWAEPVQSASTEALKLSLNVAAVSTAIALVLGTLVAIALVRQRWRGQSADTFLILPLTAPEVVMGAALLTLFLDFGWAAGYTPHDPHRTHRLRGQLHRDHGVCPGTWVRLDAGGRVAGPRRQPAAHILQSDAAADHSGHCGGRDAVVRTSWTTSSSRISSAGRR